MAAGIAVSDILLIIVCYLGASSLFEKEENKFYIGVIGGIMLIIFGVITYVRKPEILRRRTKNYSNKKSLGPLAYTFKGFILNIANPTLIIFWLTAMGWVSSHAEEGKLFNSVITFFSATVITVFGTDVLKSFIGFKIKKYLRPRLLLWINRIVGALLVVFGIVLIIQMFVRF